METKFKTLEEKRAYIDSLNLDTVKKNLEVVYAIKKKQNSVDLDLKELISLDTLVISGIAAREGIHLEQFLYDLQNSYYKTETVYPSDQNTETDKLFNPDKQPAPEVFIATKEEKSSAEKFRSELLEKLNGDKKSVLLEKLNKIKKK